VGLLSAKKAFRMQQPGESPDSPPGRLVIGSEAAACLGRRVRLQQVARCQTTALAPEPMVIVPLGVSVTAPLRAGIPAMVMVSVPELEPAGANDQVPWVAALSLSVRSALKRIHEAQVCPASGVH
jgi:hypothetical protein